MAPSSISHVQLVKILYKSILRLHKGLPTELRIIGDQYVKEEFKRHKTAKPEETQRFLEEWMKYGSQLSSQLGMKGLQPESKLGISLTKEQLDFFKEDQLGQLLELHQETSKIYGHNTKDGNE